MESNVLSTKDYSIFKTITGNREVVQSHVFKVANSIDKSNMLAGRPIIVNEKMEVIDGQHRLAAAKLLDLPIYYCVVEGAQYQDVALLNEVCKNWSSENYATMFSKQGYPHYKKILEFSKTYNAPINYLMMAIKILRLNEDRLEYVKDTFQSFKDGNFEISEKHSFKLNKYLNMLGDVKSLLYKLSVRKSKSKCHMIESRSFFLGFISFISKHENLVSFQKLLKNIELKSETFVPKARASDYKNLFLEVYNWHCSNKIIDKDEE